jgi:hypothetical protein
VVPLALVILASAGIRAPGFYNGIVFFDRWDTCYIYSGVYLMPVSEAIKEELRPYAGKFIRIDAKKVSQPFNPGDGLIKKAEFAGYEERNPLSPTDRSRLQAIDMRLRMQADSDGNPQLLVDLTNQSEQSLAPLDLALTLFAKKQGERSFFEPSDGQSYAYVTRHHLTDSINDSIVSMKLVRPPATWEIRSHKTMTLKVSLRLPMGQYQALVGNGGGVHDSLVKVSNSVSFDVTQSGSALPVE